MLSHRVSCALMLSHVLSCCLMLSRYCPVIVTPDWPLSHVVSCPADPLSLSHVVSPCPMLSVSVPWRLMLSHAVSVLILCAFDLPTCRRLSHAVPFSLIPSQSVPWHLMVSHAVSLLTKCDGLDATLLYSANPRMRMLVIVHSRRQDARSGTYCHRTLLCRGTLSSSELLEGCARTGAAGDAGRSSPEVQAAAGT
jgi:hypothetical protein